MRMLVATSNPHKLEEIRAIFGAATPSLPVDVVSLGDLPHRIDEPVEDGDTFEANAVKKARHYARAAGLFCLADDSGLEVDALGGDPGVRSARYAGVSGPRSVVDPANNKLLLERLGNTPPEYRTARFVCAMALCSPLPPGERGEFASRVRGPAEERGDPAVPAPLRPHAPSPQPSPEGRRSPCDVIALVRGTVEGRILLPVEAADPLHPERGRGSNGFGYDPLFLITARGRTTAELDPDDKNAISHRGNAARAMLQELRAMARQ